MKITMAHGSGGKATSELISTIFAKHFNNPVLSRMEDSAVVPGAATLALTTDSFVVNPLFFPGGDIGKLSVCGTVNDLAMSGATPKYLTCGFILEEGADTDELEKIVVSMADAAAEAGVSIVAGDTKVIEGKGGIYINTSGVGFLPNGSAVSSANCKMGDVVLLSGNLGDHHAAILSARMSISNTITSDCAPLNGIVSALIDNQIKVKAMRDVTRGGLATVLNEFASASKCCISLCEEQIPVTEQVRGFCGILGLDPLYMGNEGKMVAVVAKQDAQKALQAMQGSQYGENAAIIGEVIEGEAGTLLLNTAIGGTRILTELYGEGLPRIC
jgi:hydrogenase expression/formation protein HypE